MRITGCSTDYAKVVSGYASALAQQNATKSDTTTATDTDDTSKSKIKTSTQLLKELTDYVKSVDNKKAASADDKKTATGVLKDMTDYINSVDSSTSTVGKVGTALVSELNTYINSKDSSKSASATAAKSGTQIISDLTAYVKATDATNSKTASSTTVTSTTADMLKQYLLTQQVNSAGTFFDAATADFLIEDYPVISYQIKIGEQDKLRVAVDAINTPPQYGFAVKKGGNAELLKKFNEGLAKIKADGTYDKIVKQYL